MIQPITHGQIWEWVPFYHAPSLGIFSNILEGGWIIGRNISNLWDWSLRYFIRLLQDKVTPDELGLTLVTYVSWVVSAQSCLSNALPNFTCTAANSASPSQDPSLACVGPSWVLNAERYLINAFNVQAIKWNICGALRFSDKKIAMRSQSLVTLLKVGKIRRDSVT